MSNQGKVIVSLDQGTAKVAVGNRDLLISQSGQFDREYFCPVELVSAALGS